MNKKGSLFHISKRDALPLAQGTGPSASASSCWRWCSAALITTLLTEREPPQRLRHHSGRRLRLCPPYLASPSSNTAVLLGISLAVTPAFKMRFWNIGAEGQTLIGCLATAACMILPGRTSSPTAVLILMLLWWPAPAGRRPVGLPARLLQGQMEHQRDAVHPDDELHRHPAGRLLHHRLGGAPRAAGKIGIINQSTRARLAARDRQRSTCCPSSLWRC